MKRAVGLLVVSLLAGALLAQDKNESLRDRVRALRMEIEAQTRPDDAGAPSVRFYDVAAVFLPLQTTSTTDRDLPTSIRQPPEVAWTEPFSTWEQQSLLEFVAEAVGDEAQLSLRSGLLRVFGPSVIHERVKRLLAFAAERTREKFIVELEIRPLRHDDPSLGRASVRCANGVEQAYSATVERSYVFDYDEESAREAGIGDSRTAAISEGLAGDVLICLDRRAGGVLAHMRIHWQRLAAEPRSADTQHGPVTLPILDVVRLRSSAWLPFDRPVVVATCTRGMTPCQVVVRVRVAE